jgi:hypothetical protein
VRNGSDYDATKVNAGFIKGHGLQDILRHAFGHPASIAGPAAPHRPLPPTSQKGTPAVQVLLVWRNE